MTQEWLKDYMCCDKTLHFTVKAFHMIPTCWTATIPLYPVSRFRGLCWVPGWYWLQWLGAQPHFMQFLRNKHHSKAIWNSIERVTKSFRKHQEPGKHFESSIVLRLLNIYRGNDFHRLKPPATMPALHLELVNMDKVNFVQKTQMIVDSGTSPKIFRVEKPSNR